MTHIDQLMDPGLLAAMISEGYIRQKRHPIEPFILYSYTEAAQYGGVWNDATRQCRGLITDVGGNIQARPWSKFFNHNQPEAGNLDLDAPVEVTDKADGSLGIGWLDGADQFRIATRGSFQSEQAQWADQYYWNHLRDGWLPEPGLTYLFEIIYPQNRIVLDYGQREDLILLGVVDTETGADLPDWMDVDWPASRAERFSHRTLHEALAAEPRPNAEGLVVRFTDTGQRVKIKQDDYVALHKIVTGLTERSVWEALANDRWDEFVSVVPDEFHPWCESIRARLNAEFTALWTKARTAYIDITDGDPYMDRKTFALEASKHPDLRPYLFMMLDANHAKLDAAIWRAIKPAGDTYMTSIGNAA
ncbi:RNA ligase [Prescottella agglutinans]|uniref:RNA ligase n=1 Tax=Prescottella agglutinans TaxID=1644129 RepID=A0ABT6MEV1_9NOCA|nr:RNA ligase [Prescottella agglutinans]MDH6282843.1 RNA ligase [Prescottella agglutinans]